MKIPEGWPTREMVDAAWHEIFGTSRPDTNGTERITYALTAALAAAPTPPAQEDEPVAEVIDGEVIWLSSPGEVKDGELLYTRPKS